MSIEASSKATSSEASKAPKASEANGSKKNGSGGSQSADAKSFLSIFGALDESTTSVMPEAVDNLLAVDARLDKLKALGGPSLLDPALLLAQAPVLPTPVNASEGTAKPLGKGRIQHPGSLSALSGANATAANSVLDLAKTGKAALDAAPGAKFGLGDALSGQSTDAGTSGQEPVREVLSEKVVKFVQELVASMAKTPEISTVSLGAGSDRAHDLQPLRAKAVSDEPFVTTANQQGAGGAMGVDGVLATAEGAATDGEFSEEVSYWIGQDIQKAEMTLDGLGLNPVEVSISMQGNEAQVMFRTDEVQTREALSSAAEELQEALSRQGVALSSVSVGTSHSGGAQQQNSGGGQRPGWKVGTVEVAEVAQAAQTVRTLGPGRTVDLFV